MAFDGGGGRRGLSPHDIQDARRLLGKVLDRLEDCSWPGGQARSERAHFAGRVYRSRRLRNKYFPENLFADAAWDILLLLYSLEADGKKISVSAVCGSAGVPESTGHRWIERLEHAGLVVREKHPSDRRVNWVRLSNETVDRMDSYFEDMLESYFP